MSHAIRVGTTNPILFFRAFDTDGTAKVDLASAEAGLTLSVYRTGGSSVAIASLSDKAADDTAHADGAIRQVGSGNLYTVDAPDAAVASQFGSVSIKGSYTAGVIEGVPHPLVGYDGATVAVGANTTTPLDAAGVRTAVGMAAANLDTQLADLPTVSEFNARTLAAADYFDPAADAVANVTLVATTTTNTDMRGTDGANTTTPLDAAGVRTAVGMAAANLDTQLADIPTVAEFNARTLVAADYFDPATDAVANVTLVDTTTTNTDMRGTDGANTATPLDAAGVRTAVGMTAANLDTQLADIPTVAEFNARTLVAADYFDPAADTVANVTLVATTTTNTDMRGTDGANTTTPLDAAGVRTAVGMTAANMDTQLADIPTVSEFNARTLVAADYFDPAADAVANVTLVATTTTNTDMRGTDSAALPGDEMTLTTAERLKFVTVDTGEVSAASGSVAALSQGATSGGDITSILGTPLTETTAGNLAANVATFFDNSDSLTSRIVDNIGVSDPGGARLVTVTVTDGTDPLENAVVRLTEGANNYALVTDASGEAIINLDDATYSVAITKAGYSFAGASLVINGPATPTYPMGSITVTLPSDPNQSTGTIRCYNEQGVAEPGVNVSVQVQKGPGTAGLSYDSALWTEASDMNGDASFVGLVQGAVYRAYRGSETNETEYFEFQVPVGRSSFLITELIGSE